MPRYLIHVGPHKTGTTYLQTVFAMLHETLAARGVLYPDIWRQGGGHANLPRNIRDESPDLPGEFAALEAGRHNTVLISAEGLSDLSVDHVKQLRALLRDSPAQIVFYIRRWSELIPSAWREQIKHGHVETLPEYVLRVLRKPSRTAMSANLHQHINNYITVFGEESVKLVSYNNVLEGGKDIFEHFCRTFLRWLPPKIDIPRKNVSLSAVDAELIRVVNAMAIARTGAPFPQLHHSFQGLTRSSRPEMVTELTDAMASSKGTLTLDDDVFWFRRMYSLMFEEYGRLLVPPARGDWFFRPKRLIVEYIQQDYLTSEGAVQALSRLYYKLTREEWTRARKEPLAEQTSEEQVMGVA